MWDLPGPGIEPVSPALTGGFSTTEPPGKPKRKFFCVCEISNSVLFSIRFVNLGPPPFVSRLHFLLLPVGKQVFRVGSSTVPGNLDYPHLLAKIVSCLFYSDLEKRDGNDRKKKVKHFYSGRLFFG